MRRFKFDRGDWIATRAAGGEWQLAGKVVEADSETITVAYRGERRVYEVETARIARVRWRGRGRWVLA